MSKKTVEAAEVVSTKFGAVVSALLAGEKVSLAGLNVGEKFFISELSHEGKRAVFAREHLLKGTLEESRKELSAYMKAIREALGSPKSDSEIYKVSERIRKALSIALDREFPSDKKGRQARPTQGNAETTETTEEEEDASAEVAPELALSQLEGNLFAVMDNALKAGAGTKSDLFQFAVMTLKQWAK